MRANAAAKQRTAMTMPSSSTISAAPARVERRVEVGRQLVRPARGRRAGPEPSSSRPLDEQDAARRDRPVEIGERGRRCASSASDSARTASAVDRRGASGDSAGSASRTSARSDARDRAGSSASTSSSTRQARRSGGVSDGASSPSAARRAARSARRALQRSTACQQASTGTGRGASAELRQGESCPCPERRTAALSAV